MADTADPVLTNDPDGYYSYVRATKILHVHPFLRENPWLRSDDPKLVNASAWSLFDFRSLYAEFVDTETRVMMFFKNISEIHIRRDLLGSYLRRVFSQLDGDSNRWKYYNFQSATTASQAGNLWFYLNLLSSLITAFESR